jgi:hypothetical protein
METVCHVPTLHTLSQLYVYVISICCLNRFLNLSCEGDDYTFYACGCYFSYSGTLAVTETTSNLSHSSHGYFLVMYQAQKNRLLADFIFPQPNFVLCRHQCSHVQHWAFGVSLWSHNFFGSLYTMYKCRPQL